MSVYSLDEWRKKQGNTSRSKSQSKQNTPSDEHGQTPTDAEMEGLKAIMMLLTIARMKPFTTKSALARDAATEIALCAIEGLLTTKVNENTYSNVWMVTQQGLDYIEEFEDVFSP